MSRLPVFDTRVITTSKTAKGGGVRAGDTDIVAVFQDTGKKAIPPKGGYSTAVEKFRKGEAFVARAGAVQFVRFGGQTSAENVVFVGFGQAEELTEEKARQAGGTVWAKLQAEKVKGAVVHAESFYEAKGLRGETSPLRIVRAFAEGMILAAYQFNKHRSKVEDAGSGVERVTFVTQDRSLKAEIDRVHAVGEAVTVTRDWSNEPSNFGTPEFYAAEVTKLAKQYGLKARVLTEAEARREGMGLFIGVGQGSDREGRVIVVEYNPKGGKKAKTVALVGKGITFDSGGISIKPSARMEEMKHDMTGAATVMGAAILASLWGVSNRVVAVMGFTENMPGGDAIQPGNVLKARNGKTVEVINTDAEGRLILADILDYAQDFKPDAIVDVATLTGAVSIALGKHACAVLGNDETLIDAVRRAGESNGERVWQLPLWDEYFEDLKSDCADMKNSANDGNGGTIRGAIFLKQFIRKGVSWAHLDIASTAWGLTHLSYYPKKGASGAYVRTLAQLAADF